MKIFIKTKPNSKQNKVVQKGEFEFDVFVKAPAQEGKANKAVIDVLSEYFSVPKSHILIKAGHSSRSKIVEIL